MTYTVTQSDPGAMLFEGQKIVPLYEDEQQLIVPAGNYTNHVRKSGEYFASHFKKTEE